MNKTNQNDIQRREMLKQMLRELHQGKSVDEVKAKYGQLLEGVDALEISTLEQALLDEGVPEEEITSLCDLHVDAFKAGLSQPVVSEDSPQLSVNTYLKENAAAGKILDQLEETIGSCDWGESRRLYQELRKFEVHYVRKENILFPYLERHHFTGPSSVMWAIHDSIRKGWKELDTRLTDHPDLSRVNEVFQPLAKAMREMFYKEETILFPTARQLLSPEEWEAIQAQESEAGLYFPESESQTISATPSAGKETVQILPEIPEPEMGGLAHISLQTGQLTLQQIDLLFTHLPVDVTFVDENDEVRYFSATRDRIFHRAPAVIGRKVQKCHPVSSVQRVQHILDDFRSGKRDVAEFWIQRGPADEKQFVYIRYFAVRDERGQYRGTLEVTQDVTAIRTLEGEHRLDDDK